METQELATAVPLSAAVVEEGSRDLFFSDAPIKYYSWVSSSEFVATPYDKTIIDMLLDGRTYGECVKVAKDHYHKDLTVTGIKRRLEENKYAKDYLESRLREKAIAEGLTKESYLVMCKKILDKELNYSTDQLSVFNRLPKVMGWEGVSSGVMNFQTINILQRDGRE